MKYGLCTACRYFREDVKTPFIREPKHCQCPQLAEWFSSAQGGFISGTDIIHCDYFRQHDYMTGDVLIKLPKGGFVSYVITKKRKEAGYYYLTDNSKNIKIINGDIVDVTKHRLKRLEKNHQGCDSDFECTDGCPF